MGAVANAISSYEQCLKLMPAARNAGQNRLLALNYIHQGEEPAVCAAHLEWGDQLQAATTPLPPPLPPAAAAAAKARPLRVGYMSPDFYTHSVSYFAEAPLTHHSASAVVPYAYSCVVRADGKTAHLRQAVLAAGGVWRDVAALSEEALARQIRSDGIDVLVELTGHTAHNRLGTMAFQPAPVQVTWIGYPNSTGLRRVHYRFTDAVCDPEDTTQTYAEQLIRLPSCFLCYSPTVDAPPVSPLPALSNGFFTFGSFNNLAKMTPQVMYKSFGTSFLLHERLICGHI